MKPRLVNVRLDEARLRKVRRLRARGVSLAEVVRDAIDVRYGELSESSRPDAVMLVRSIIDSHPDAEGTPAREYDVHDRRSARAAAVRRLARKSR